MDSILEKSPKVRLRLQTKDRWFFALAFASLLLALAACSDSSNNPSKQATLFKPAATLQEIMTSIIDPNADEVWNSVATIITATGIEERSPQTDEEWQAVRRHAVTLAETSNLLIIEGRQIAAPGASTSSVPAEASAEEIQANIAAHRQEFVARAHALQAATQQAIAAIDAKNTEELVRVGGVIDQACEGCHVQFWYPGDKRP